MKLLIISTMSGFPWGGSEELWFQTALEGVKKGYTVHAVVMENKPTHPNLSLLKNAGITVDIIKKTVQASLYKKIISKLLRRHFTPKESNRFLFIKNYCPDAIILSQGGTVDFINFPDLCFFLENSGTPFFIINQHNNESGSFSAHQKKIIADIFSKALKVFFVANRNKDVLERQLAKKINNAEIIKNPLKIKNPEVLNWPEISLPHFAVVARLQVDFKGQDILLQTLSHQKWQNRKFIVNFFGTGLDDDYLNDLIKFYNLSDKVFIKGHAAQIEKIWDTHHVLILPSHSEGTPLSVVEAMVCGRPCLVTDVGDCATLIQHEQTGWVAATSSVEALDETLELLWNSQKEWQKMGTKAAAFANEFVDIDAEKTLLKKIVEVYATK